MDSSKMNYTPFEKNILYEIIEKNIEIIESKKNDAKMIAKKNKIWIEIHNEFSDVQETYNRTEKQLRFLWKNMKGK